MSPLERVQSALLTAALPYLMPKALAYAEHEARRVQAEGSPLDARGLDMARGIGIEHPELVRRLIVPTMPVPQDRLLRVVARMFGVLDAKTPGLTLGYNLLTRQGHETDESEQSHELAHVRQFEEFVAARRSVPAPGGHVYGHGDSEMFKAFVGEYLEQLVRYGHDQAPLEIDARGREHLGLQGGSA